MGIAVEDKYFQTKVERKRRKEWKANGQLQLILLAFALDWQGEKHKLSLMGLSGQFNYQQFWLRRRRDTENGDL